MTTLTQTESHTNGGPPSIPEGWQTVTLKQFCEINPRRPPIDRPDDAPTTFVPMPAVAEAGGGITRPELRPFREVRKGYTYFGEGDVLFAKITPCMQNGKHAIARNLTDGIGFGSTEFHVLRPRPGLSADWLHLFLLQPTVLQDATAHFTGAVGQQRIPGDYLSELSLPIAPPPDQDRIIARLRGQLDDAAGARTAIDAQLATLDKLTLAVLRDSLQRGCPKAWRFADCLQEVTEGIGSDWQSHALLGATRAGLAPAKETAGKNPGRYKPVRQGTIFYNPMRILLGSIAMVDEGDTPGITSPDYVVLTAVPGRLSARWFYHWFRSQYGAEFIKSMTRGAVRERLMFRRLAPATILLPNWETQQAADTQLLEIRRLKKTLMHRIATLDHLPAALLRDTFAGKA